MHVRFTAAMLHAHNVQYSDNSMGEKVTVEAFKGGMRNGIWNGGNIEKR